jgi:hypothetical protein
MELFFNRDYDDLEKDGSRTSERAMRTIARLYPEAIWHKENEDSWRIVVE